MQTATGESSYPVLGAITWDRTYEAVLATPARPADVVAGHLLYVGFRVTTSAAAFLLVLVAFGAARSPLVALTVPVALLTGLAFAAPVTAMAARLEEDAAFAALQRILLVPVFLFSGTFFPVDRLPGVLEAVAHATPLWHGVTLARELALGTAGVGPALLHAGYLALWVLAGTLLATRALTRRMVR
jgi:lipooligosaccharide transport system permease protein